MRFILAQSKLTIQQQQLALLASFMLTFIAAALGSIASIEAADFYRQLQLPSWAPPGWLFGPVWTVLYVLMACALWLVWRLQNPLRRVAIPLFILQLAINALWSWLFFAWHLGGFAFVDVLLLLALIAANLYYFWRVSRLAALLLSPYLLWVVFAAFLNFSVWQRNPQLL